ncbi:hypothetical protein MKW98_004639 [Papaver atlanticum]|uniref:Piwi domain-containing protein n=1 Tax=Papaver atlanticum TaxID=357466 RepID=A0AAD4SNL6_9MAGN|nr:hypothetical protein MKW98_004639 [Papaver atlanticum]
MTKIKADVKRICDEQAEPGQRRPQDKCEGRELLISFRTATGQKPQCIIIYRDGESEGQFYQIYSMSLMLFASMGLQF